MSAPPWLGPVIAAAVTWVLIRDDTDARKPPPVGARATRADRDYVTGQVAMMGWPKDEVDRVIMRESGWRPSAIGPKLRDGHPVGLIQFMPKTLRAMGYPGTWRDFARLSAKQQAPYVVRFFRPYRWTRPGDTYVATAWPAALGKSDSYVIAEPGSVVWKQNPSLRESKTGPITAGSIRRRIL